MSQILKPKKGYKLVDGLFQKKLEIPNGWKIRKIDDLFEFPTTGTNSRSDLGTSGDIQYIHYGDIHTKWNSILDCDVEEIPWISKSKVEKIPLLKEGDLIIADVSEDYDGSGISILLKNVKNKKIVSGLHTVVLRNKDESVSLDFKTYLTSIKFVKSQIISRITGISVYGLSKNNLKEIEIPLPSVPEQKKISSILHNMDSMIIQTQKAIEQTQILQKGLTQQLFSKKISNGNFRKVKWLFGKEIKIPKDWIYQELKHTTKLLGGYAFKSEDYVEKGVSLLKISNVSHGNLIWNEESFLPNNYWNEHNEYQINKGDLVMAMTRPIINTGIKISRVKSNKKTLLNQRVGKFISSLDNDFLNYFINSNYFILQIKRGLAETNQPNISSSEVEATKIWFPKTQEEQKKIANILNSVDSKISELQSQKFYFEKLKKISMHKLLAGEIKVKI